MPQDPLDVAVFSLKASQMAAYILKGIQAEPHALVLSALLAAFEHVANGNPCCTAGASMQASQAATRLMAKAAMHSPFNSSVH